MNPNYFILEIFIQILDMCHNFMNTQNIANLGYAALGLAIVIVGMNHYFG